MSERGEGFARLIACRPPALDPNAGSIAARRGERRISMPTAEQAA
jgi:hypothetical protein